MFVRARSEQFSSERPKNGAFDGTLALRDAYQIRSLIEPFAEHVATPMLHAIISNG